MGDPLRNTRTPQLEGSPRRRYYTGPNLARAIAIEDLRAMTHKRLPRFVLEYLEGGAEEEATLTRERDAYGEWLFSPRTLVDVSQRSLATEIFGREASMPLVVAPTGLNGLFGHHSDLMLARAAARHGVPFTQSTMSNDRMEEVAKVPGLRHWWQLYVFGGDEVWQELVRRADACGCEALVLTTNAQIFGDREWSLRTRRADGRPSLPTVFNAALHPDWLLSTLVANVGLPVFRNVVDLVPRDKRGFFQCSDWIRQHQPTSLDWHTVDKIRQRWRKPFLLKGIMNLGDVQRAVDAGVDGIILATHGGRQLDFTLSPLDLLPQACEVVQGRIPIFLAGGVRRGTDLLKALALGASAVLAGRAILYGVCAAGRPGASKALDILHKEANHAMGLLGAASLADLTPQLLQRRP